MIQVYLAPVGEDREAALISAVRDALADVQRRGRRLRRHEGPDPPHHRGAARLQGPHPAGRARRRPGLPRLAGRRPLRVPGRPGLRISPHRRTAATRPRSRCTSPRAAWACCATTSPDRAAPGQRAGDPVAPGPRPPAAGRAPGGGQVEPAVASVHRRGYMDYVGVRRYGDRRQAVGRGPLRGPVHRRGL